MNERHSKGNRAARLHYRLCPRCGRRFSDLDAHYKAKHLKNDLKRLKQIKKGESKP